ncbi:hypothetical protein [Nostoc sp.]|uniref:hypothetical protein n=1 Tax=Nostoc sp. TaxID=1180 RepID=UPI002FF8AAA8
MVSFQVKSGKGKAPEPPKTGRGAKFDCLASGLTQLAQRDRIIAIVFSRWH